MKTKITKKDIIKALKIRMNSVLIEHSFDKEDFISANISVSEYNHCIEAQLQDLKELIESL